MDVYVHSEGREEPELIKLEGSAVVRQLIVGEAGDSHIWIKELEEELDLDITLDTAGIRHGHHVHHGRCRTVEVTVRFNSERHSRAFRSVATIRTVFDWATGTDAFGLTLEEKAKHVLAVPGADHFLDWDVVVGSLVGTEGCDVLLDLLPRKRFEG